MKWRVLSGPKLESSPEVEGPAADDRSKAYWDGEQLLHEISDLLMSDGKRERGGVASISCFPFLFAKLAFLVLIVMYLT